MLATLIGLAVGIALIALVFVSRGRKSGPTGRPRPEEPSDFPRLAAEMKARAEPTLLLWPTDEKTFSRIGGAPDLDDLAAWPEHEGRQRAFLAQFDLAAVRSAGGPKWLGDKGFLYVFVGVDDKGKLDEPENPLEAVWRAKAGAGPLLDGPAPFAERRLVFERRQSYPDVEMLDDIRTINVDDHELDQLSALHFEPYEGEPTNGYGDVVTSRIGGFPDPIQSQDWQLECEVAARGLKENIAYTKPLDPELVAGSRDWRMIAQFATDERFGLKWPGSGALYLYVREADARGDDFSKTQALWQAY